MIPKVHVNTHVYIFLNSNGVSIRVIVRARSLIGLLLTVTTTPLSLISHLVHGFVGDYTQAKEEEALSRLLVCLSRLAKAHCKTGHLTDGFPGGALRPLLRVLGI